MVLFFGELWEPFLKNYLKSHVSLNQIFQEDIRLAYTNSLKEFIGDSQMVREKKIQTFRYFKKFFSL